jgi:hypothetical protein
LFLVVLFYLLWWICFNNWTPAETMGLHPKGLGVRIRII